MTEWLEWIKDSNNIVFFGGAGVSTESGIPDFRSVDGIYNQKYAYPPEEIISHSYFMAHPDKFYEFYKDRMIYPDAKPNTTHLVLAKMEEMGKLKAVVTQNIDGLHQLAGSKVVYELHGSILRNYCMKCHTFYPLEKVIESEGIPHCDKCGGIIKPDVVLYEEGLDEDIIMNSVRAISEADVLIVGGTSLVVQPAASLIRYYRGNKLILVNKSTTPYDRDANVVLHESLGKVFGEIDRIL
jgi:NAD-dependent deacetylase